MLKPRPAPEKVVQQQIVTALRRIGATVYVIGHAPPRDGRRHFGTGQTPGIPDLFAFLPARAGRRETLWIEVKREGGRVRPEQLDFAQLCLEAQAKYVRGTLDDVYAWLVDHGYILADSLPHYRQPQPTGER